MDEIRYIDLKIKDVRSIEALRVPLEWGGVVAQGKNGEGKTTVAQAFLMGIGAEPMEVDAIRIDENGRRCDRAEVEIDLGGVTLTRTTRSNGKKSLVLTDRDGIELKAPATKLKELLGSVQLIDPLALIRMKGPERRAAVLAALDVRTNIAELRKWAPDLPETFSCEGHGLDVVKRAHEILYKQRTAANAEADRLAAEASTRANEAQAAAFEPSTPYASVADVEAGLQRARARWADVQAAEKQLVLHNDRTAKARARISALRDEAAAAFVAKEILDAMCEGLDNAKADVEATQGEVRRLEIALAKVKQQAADAERGLASWQKRVGEAEAAVSRSHDLTRQAADLETSIDAAAPVAPTAEETQAALDAVEAAEQAVQDAAKAERARALAVVAKEARERAKVAKAAADHLDAQVKKLSNDAPRTLLARADGIEGLDVTDDDVALDGVSMTGLAESERLWTATQIARRANAKSRVLMVDGLEALDPEALPRFVRWATSPDADGRPWYLVATLVKRGQLVLVEPGKAAADQDAENERAKKAEV